jgi:hypothetical protein
MRKIITIWKGKIYFHSVAIDKRYRDAVKNMMGICAVDLMPLPRASAAYCMHRQPLKIRRAFSYFMINLSIFFCWTKKEEREKIQKSEKERICRMGFFSW